MGLTIDFGKPKKVRTPVVDVYFPTAKIVEDYGRKEFERDANKRMKEEMTCGNCNGSRYDPHLNHSTAYPICTQC